MSASTPSLDRGLYALLHFVNEELVHPQQRRELPIPEHLRTICGGSPEQPLTMTTARYQSDAFDALTVASITTGSGHLCSLTVVGIPGRNTGFPIVGIDLVALRGSLSLIAVDLAPTDDVAWDSYCAPLLRALTHDLSGVVTPRKRPDFTEGVFSPLAVIAGAHAGAESSVFAALSAFLRKVADLPAQMTGSDQTLSASSPLDRRELWLAAERRNRKEHNALAKLFGAALATEYLDRFLFASLTDAQPVSQPCNAEAADVSSH